MQRQIKILYIEVWPDFIYWSHIVYFGLPYWYYSANSDKFDMAGKISKTTLFYKKKKKKNEMKKLIWVCKKYEFVVFRRQISKNRNILPEIIGFFKIVAEIQQLVWKRSQKINSDVILHYISLPIYPFHFPNFRPIPKQ